MAYREPALFERLIALLTDATVAYLAAQIEAGAEAVMLFDSWAGVLSPRLFRLHVIQPTATIVSRLRSRFPTVPVIGFPRLAGLMVGDYAVATAVDAVGLDTSMDPALVMRCVPRTVALQGNLDPMALVAWRPSVGARDTGYPERGARTPVHLQSGARHRAADAAGTCGEARGAGACGLGSRSCCSTWEVPTARRRSSPF